MTHTQEEADAELRKQVCHALGYCENWVRQGCDHVDNADDAASKDLDAIMAVVQAHNARIRDKNTKYDLREAILWFYAGMQGKTYEEVRDEYLGRPAPGADRYAVNNRLYVHVEAAVAHQLAAQLSPIQPKKQGKP